MNAVELNVLERDSLILLDFDGCIASLPFFDPPVGDLRPFVFDPEIHYFETPSSVRSVQSAELMADLRLFEEVADIAFLSRTTDGVLDRARTDYGLAWPRIELTYRSREPKFDAICDHLANRASQLERLVWVDDDENLAWPTEVLLHEAFRAIGITAPVRSLILSPQLEVGITRADVRRIGEFLAI